MRHIIASALAATLSAAAFAADRCVLVEEFTATWCVYCPPVGQALSGLQDGNAESMAFYQIHGDDAYEITWGGARMQFYGVPGYPTVWMDGVLERVGQYPSPQYTTDFNARVAQTTDVTIQSWAVQVNTNTWTVTSRVAVEANGQPRPMKVRLLQVLDHYPAGSHYRNCLMQNSPQTVTTVAPGQSVDVSHTFTLSPASMGSLSNVRFITFAQNTGNAPSGSLVYQSEMMSWPFNEEPTQTPGDADSDGDVDLADLSTVLTNFGSTTADWSDGDFDNDNDVDLTDLSALLVNFGS
jgi:hypothetical protein